MRNKILVVLICLVSAVLAVLAGCLAKDENADWSPASSFPSWTYDAPYYHEPATPLKPESTVGNDIPVYYTRDADFFIAHPNGWQQNIAPQVSIWYSNTCGESWNLDGYFGLEQRYFIFHAEHDGHYWIRFVGPNPSNEKGQGVATVPPGQPHEIYVVDTHAPTINITVTPSPWEDDDRTIPHIYRVGDTIELQWSVADMSLMENSVTLGTAYAKFPDNVVWSNYDGKLGPVGKMSVTIPEKATKKDGIRFRMLAEDRAKNVGIGMTDILHVALANRPDGPATKTTKPAATTKAVSESQQAPEAFEFPLPVMVSAEGDETASPVSAKAQPKPQLQPDAELMEPVSVVQPSDPRSREADETVRPRSEYTRKWAQRIKPAKSGKTLESSEVATSSKPLESSEINSMLPESFGDETAAKTPAPKAQPKTSDDLLEEVTVEKSPEDETMALIEVPINELAEMETAIAPAAEPKIESEVAPIAAAPIAAVPVSQPKIEKAPVVVPAAPKAVPTPVAVAPKSEATPAAIAAVPVSQPKVEKAPVVVPAAPKAVPTPVAAAPAPKPAATPDASSGWNLAGKKLSTGSKRLFTVQNQSHLEGKKLRLQFSSDGGNQWTLLKDNMEPGRTVMWAVPATNSQNCRLRIVSVEPDKLAPLAISPRFAVINNQEDDSVAQTEE
ncbi:MAG: hypothetical protein KAR11_03625 [Phycisphaerae bacterium]|nr:hypothetical protein [Phycisphaerae bacterium]